MKLIEKPVDIDFDESPLLRIPPGLPVVGFKKQIVLSIEGNIGAGKSTFLRTLIKHFGEENIEFVPEPVHMWTNCNGHNLLEAFYKDPARYAYMFQSFALLTRLMNQQKPQKKMIRILERSCLSDFCFAANCKDTGLMNELEFAAYQTYYSYFIKNTPGGPDGIIYLRASPETCFNRMARRNRHEESSVPLDYLTQIHDRHESWLPVGKGVDTVRSVPFVTLEGDLEFESIEDNQVYLIKSVLSLIARIQN